MKRFVPYEKLSKKAKREWGEKKRGSWQGIDPVSRKSENPRAYRRSKAQQWRKDSCCA